MATVYSDAYGKPAYLPKTGELGVQWGVYNAAAALSKDDLIDYFTIPAQCAVIDGLLRAADLDTGTEALEIDVGTSGDPDKYLDSGVLDGDAILGVKSTVGIRTYFNSTIMSGAAADCLAIPELTASEEIYAKIVAAAAGGGTGKIGLWMSYTRLRT